MKDEWALTITGAIGNWLGKEDSIIAKHVVQVINTKGWFCAIDDPDFLYDEIKVLYNFFKSLLGNAGHKGILETVGHFFSTSLIFVVAKFLNATFSADPTPVARATSTCCSLHLLFC